MCSKNRVFSPQKQIFNLKTVKSFTLHFFALTTNIVGMKSCRFRAISYQITRKVGAGYNPSNITETLIGYTGCYLLSLF